MKVIANQMIAAKIARQIKQSMLLKEQLNQKVKPLKMSKNEFQDKQWKLPTLMTMRHWVT